MVEEREKLTTPVRIEYNIDSNTEEFNVILNSTHLFENMHRLDPSLQILSIAIKIRCCGTIKWNYQRTTNSDKCLECGINVFIKVI